MPEQSFSPDNTYTRNPETNKPLGQELFESLMNPNNPRSLETRTLQIKCLKRIGESFIDEAYAHLYSDYLNNERIYQSKVEHALKNGEPIPTKEPYDDETVLTGFVNEALVRNQIDLTRPELISSELDKDKRSKLRRIGDTVLEIAHQPNRFDLELYGRTPDIAWLSMAEDNKIIIEGAGEITTGRLNKRKFLQLQESGYNSHLKEITRHLNQMTDSDKHGLANFGLSGIQIEVSPHFKQYVVLRRDADDSIEGLSANIGPVVPDAEFNHLNSRERQKCFSQTEHDRFLRQLTDLNRTEIIKSGFTAQEIRKITEIIVKKIKNKFPSYEQSTQQATQGTNNSLE